MSRTEQTSPNYNGGALITNRQCKQEREWENGREAEWEIGREAEWERGRV